MQHQFQAIGDDKRVTSVKCFQRAKVAKVELYQLANGGGENNYDTIDNVSKHMLLSPCEIFHAERVKLSACMV